MQARETGSNAVKPKDLRLEQSISGGVYARLVHKNSKAINVNVAQRTPWLGLCYHDYPVSSLTLTSFRTLLDI